MPNQSQIQQTILNGSYALSTLVNNNLNLVNSGGLPIERDYISYFNLSLQGLIYQYQNLNYTSSTTVTLYQRINAFVGVPYGAQVDPNFQNSNIIINSESSGFEPITETFTEANLVDADPPNGNWYLPVTLVNSQRVVSVTINNVGFTVTPDYTTSPARLYGFANNDSQSIVVTII